MIEPNPLRDASADPPALASLVARRWRGSAGTVAVRTDGIRVMLHRLFHLSLHAESGGERVRAHVTGWDRDLTGLLERSTLADAPALLDAVDDLMTRTMESMTDAAPQASLIDTAGRGPAPMSDRVAEALAAREARTRGVDPVHRLDGDHLEALVRRRWPRTAIDRSDERGGTVRLEGRPYKTFRFAIATDHHGPIGGAVMVDDEAVGELYGRRLFTDGDASSVGSALETIDIWLRTTVPAASILAFPLVAPPTATRR